jgi:hypothetical protein
VQLCNPLSKPCDSHKGKHHTLSVLQGWTVPYDFSVADLRAAADVVAAAAAGSGSAGPDWEQLLGLLSVIYGGRVSSKQDVLVLSAHLLDTFSQHLLTTLPGRTSQQQQQQQQQRQLPYGITACLPRSLALPTSGQKHDWLAYVAELPDTDQPAALGLPANVKRSMALGHFKAQLASLRQMNAAQVRSG